METVKGLYTDVNPLYMKAMVNLTKADIEVLLLAQFILINKSETKGRTIPFGYALVSRLARSFSIKMSKQKYTKSIKELITNGLFIKHEEDTITLGEYFDYISFEGLVGEEE